MRRILSDKPEPFLLVVPLILFLISKFLINSFAIDTAILFWAIFISAIVPFMLHFFLRASRKWQSKICVPHVYFTIGLLILLFMASLENSAATGISPSPGIMDALLNANHILVSIFLLQAFLQLIAVIYFLQVIFKRQHYLLP